MRGGCDLHCRRSNFRRPLPHHHCSDTRVAEQIGRGRPVSAVLARALTFAFGYKRNVGAGARAFRECGKRKFRIRLGRPKRRERWAERFHLGHVVPRQPPPSRLRTALLGAISCVNSVVCLLTGRAPRSCRPPHSTTAVHLLAVVHDPCAGATRTTPERLSITRSQIDLRFRHPDHEPQCRCPKC